MDNLIKIICPTCGSVLSVRYVAGIESKSVTCPICSTKSPFTAFKRKDAQVSEDDCTQLPGHYKSAGSEQPAAPTEQTQNQMVGMLRDNASGKSYQLEPGVNVVGRKASSSTAKVQLDCPDNRVSRDHIVIEVARVPGKGFVHYASLCKPKVNDTYLGDAKLEYGDKLVLNHGDVIKLPNMQLEFVIPDPEGTIF